MKIGLITIHSAENVGAVLQAYATQRYLSRFGQVEVINYIHNNRVWHKNVQQGKLTRYFTRFKRLLHPFQFFLTRKRVAAFCSFRKRYINMSDITYYGDADILRRPPVYDMYFCGSDQIWNASITRNSSAYFLSFANSPHKYAFSSSVGHADLTPEEKELAKKYLPSFAKIAVREQDTAQELSKLLNRSVQTVSDPVFLLSKEEWMNLAKPLKLPKQGYIAVYAMQENASLQRALAYAQTLGLPLVFLGKKGSNCKGTQVQAVPQEFLYVLANAQYVITNSFHGLAFALIFQRQIFVCEHTTRNLRLVNLLEQIGAGAKQIRANTPDVSICQVDGKSAYTQLNIQQGKDYLAEIFNSGNEI